MTAAAPLLIMTAAAGLVVVAAAAALLRAHPMLLLLPGRDDDKKKQPEPVVKWSVPVWKIITGECFQDMDQKFSNSNSLLHSKFLRVFKTFLTPPKKIRFYFAQISV